MHSKTQTNRLKSLETKARQSSCVPAPVSCLMEKIVKLNQQGEAKSSEWHRVPQIGRCSLASVNPCLCASRNLEENKTFFFKPGVFKSLVICHHPATLGAPPGLGVDQWGTLGRGCSFFICFLPDSLVNAGPLGFPHKQGLNHRRSPGKAPSYFPS